jgi:hypothetical protein
MWLPAGALYGVCMRFLFGVLPNQLHGPMSLGFLVGTPVAVGALAVLASCDARSQWGEWLLRSVVAIALMLLGCAITLLEGAICLAMMAPLFFAAGMVGGVLAGVCLRLTRWRKSQLGAFAVLPLLLAIGEPDGALPQRQQELRQSIDIAAPPPVVWRQILQARNIRPEELPFSWTHCIGVPRPVEGVNVRVGAEEIRFSRWERGVRFEGRVRQRQENRFIRWEYAFDAHSFPPGTMDDHVAIGGRYFDLQDTAFALEPLAGGSTRLHIVAHYRVSSSVNFYAVPVARFLGRDFIASILGLYKGRSERAVDRARA